LQSGNIRIQFEGRKVREGEVKSREVKRKATEGLASGVPGLTPGINPWDTTSVTCTTSHIVTPGFIPGGPWAEWHGLVGGCRFRFHYMCKR